MKKKLNTFSTILLMLFITINCNAQSWSRIYSFGYSGNYPQPSRWVFDLNDKYIFGDFTGNNNDELLLIKSPKAALFKFDWEASGDNRFVKIWNNDNMAIGNWTNKSNANYIVGDFSGRGKDELLCVDQDGWAMLLSFNGSQWVSGWSNCGNRAIGSWTMKSHAKYIAGDFSGRGRDELLCMDQDGWALLLYYNGTRWIQIWSNGGNDNIGGVNVKGLTSKFIPGRYRQTSKDELLTIAGNTWTTVIRYNPSRNDWDWTWSQYGAVKFASWDLPLNSRDKIVVGNFDIQNTYDEILFARAGSQNSINNPARLIGLNIANDFKSYWFNNNNNKIFSSSYTLSNLESHFHCFNYDNKKYLLWVHLNGHPDIPRVFLAILQYNNGLAKSTQDELESNSVQFSTDLKYILYPNPSNDWTIIERYSAENKCIYEIYNILGVKLQEGNIPIGQLSEIIDLSIFESGTYIIKMVEGDRIFTEKLIIP